MNGLVNIKAEKAHLKRKISIVDTCAKRESQLFGYGMPTQAHVNLHCHVVTKSMDQQNFITTCHTRRSHKLSQANQVWKPCRLSVIQGELDKLGRANSCEDIILEIFEGLPPWITISQDGKLKTMKRKII